MPKREKEKDEETIYDEGGREELIESDELNAEEEAFMRGYDEAEDDEDKEPDETKESIDEEDTE